MTLLTFYNFIFIDTQQNIEHDSYKKCFDVLYNSNGFYIRNIILNDIRFGEFNK